MFFEKMIDVCGAGGFSLESALLEQLKNGGIKANFSDLSANHSGIYFAYPSGKLQKVLLYHARIPESLFRIQGDPCVHLCGCPSCLKHLDDSEFLAVVALEKRFFVGIYSHKVQIKFFNDKPLQLCQDCVKILQFNGNLAAFLGFS